jgi:histidinol-phosphate aminotransferase
LAGFKVYNSDANFVLVKYPAGLKDKLQEAFAQANIIVKFMNEEGLRTHIRITLGRPEVNKRVTAIIKQVAQGI